MNDSQQRLRASYSKTRNHTNSTAELPLSLEVDHPWHPTPPDAEAQWIEYYESLSDDLQSRMKRGWDLWFFAKRAFISGLNAERGQA